MTDSQHSIEQSIGAIALDNKSGAAEIVQTAAKILSTLDKAITPRRVIDVCLLLVRAQTSMAPILNLANRVIQEVSTTRTGTPASVAALAASAFATDAKAAAEAVSSHAARLIKDGDTVLTHSRSSTVEGALIKAKRAGTKFSVITTESRPALEGRTLAERLARESIGVSLIADAAAALVIDRTTLILFGADCVTPAFASNKIGSRMIALIGASFRVPNYIVCDTSKFLALDAKLPAEPEHPADEIWPNAPEGVTLVNRYFEETPLELFAGVVTEEGLLEPDRVRSVARSRPLHPEVIRALGLA